MSKRLVVVKYNKSKHLFPATRFNIFWTIKFYAKEHRSSYVERDDNVRLLGSVESWRRLKEPVM